MSRLTHLQRLEAESIQIFREAVSESERPVMLYSVGKDSGVMLHLAAKAFYPSKPPFPLLHVDTTWKFRAMYEFRDRKAQEIGMDLLVYQNPERIEKGIRASMRWSIDHADYFRLFQFAATDERFSDGLRKGETVAVKDAAAQLQAAMDAGEIAAGDPVLLSHALLGVHTHLVHLVHRGVLQPTDEVIDTAVTFCLHGLLGQR